MDTALTTLLETDYIQWTPEKLRQRIDETAELLRRIDSHTTLDEDFVWIRALLADELTRKKNLLINISSAA